jgi:predicted murein hydrolase (TIGR00659 family)
MNDFFRESLFAGVTLSLLSYFIGSVLKKKFKLGIFNPLLISIIITIIVLAVSGVDYDVYNQGARYLSWFLTPATVCLAIPLYEQWSLLKKNYKAVVVGIASGVLTSLTTVLVLSKIMNLSHAEYVTLLPKSITTAIGMGVSEELGGYVTITVAVIVVTGVLGNIFGELICKIFRIKEPIAKGLALGSAAHAIGTAKAMEMGEIEGAMSSLSIAVAGILLIQAFFFRKSAHGILIIKWYKIFLCQCFSYLVTHTSTLSCNCDYHIYLFSAHAFLRITGLCQVRAGTNPACENNIFTLFS